MSPFRLLFRATRGAAFRLQRLSLAMRFSAFPGDRAADERLKVRDITPENIAARALRPERFRDELFDLPDAFAFSFEHAMDRLQYVRRLVPLIQKARLVHPEQLSKRERPRVYSDASSDSENTLPS